MFNYVGWMLVNFLANCSKGTMFMKSIDASLMIKTRKNV